MRYGVTADIVCVIAALPAGIRSYPEKNRYVHPCDWGDSSYYDLNKGRERNSLTTDKLDTAD